MRIKKKSDVNMNVNRIEELNERGYWKIGYIHRTHFLYCLSILAIIIIVLTSIQFKSSSYAGAMLSFAATLSSVLLAVIAIIITLIDVSGQKNSVFEIKEQTKQLKKTVDDFKASYEDVDNVIERIEELKESFILEIRHTKEKTDEILNALDELKNIDDKSEKDKKIIELEEKLKSKEIKSFKKSIPNFLLDLFHIFPLSEFSAYQFRRFVNSKTGEDYSIIQIKDYLKVLEGEGVINSFLYRDGEDKLKRSYKKLK